MKPQTTPTKFTVTAEILDPEDGEAGIVGQYLFYGRWYVTVIKRFGSLPQAKVFLKKSPKWCEERATKELDQQRAS